MATQTTPAATGGRKALFLELAAQLGGAAETFRALAALDDTPTTYTTAGPLPAGVSRRAFNESCRRIATARKDGRCWTVAAADWHAARDAKRPALPVTTAPAETWTPQRALEQAGLRISQ